MKFFGAIFILISLAICGTVQAQEKKKVEFLPGTNRLEISVTDSTTIHRFIGNARFKHAGTYMRCDSAWYYKDYDIVDAFGNVYIRQGDSLKIYADRLRYNGNKKIANLQGNVLLLESRLELTTEELTYNLDSEVATYSTGAIIQNEGSTLTSKKGYFHSKTNNTYFKEDVVLVNKDYTLYSDTFMQNIETEVTFFFGPTEILSDDNYIYCEAGWYDNKENKAFFRNNAFLENGPQRIEADTIFYDRTKGYGEAFTNIIFVDTVQNSIIRSDYAEYFEHDQIVIATKNAILTNIIDNDSLHVHGDTLRTFNDTIENVQYFFAYKNVRIFKNNLQGVCDSLTYNDKDSILYMYRNPVLWSDNNQFSADTIDVRFKQKKLKQINLSNNAFLASMEDSLVYNQINGKNIYGYFRDDTLRNMKVMQNAKSIYYVQDDNGAYIGANKALCSNIFIYLKEGRVHRTTCIGEPEGTMDPVQQIKLSDFLLDKFIWHGEKRPNSIADLLK